MEKTQTAAVNAFLNAARIPNGDTLADADLDALRLYLAVWDTNNFCRAEGMELWPVPRYRRGPAPEPPQGMKESGAEIQAFIRALYGPYERGWIEVRCFKAGQAAAVSREWFLVTDACADSDKLAAFALAACGRGLNVYVGVLPRATYGKGKKADVTEAACFWAELDFDKCGGEAETRKKADDAAPDILVQSGGGLHLYWMLASALTLTPDNLKRFETAMKRKQAALGSDPVQDASRVLRLPGTLNVKREPHRKVTLLRCP